MTDNDLIAVPSNVADAAGRIIWWRLSGAVDREKLIETLEDFGIPDHLLPDRVTPDRALKLAMQEHTNKRTLVRPLGHGVRGYAIVHEDANGRVLAHQQELTAEIQKVDDGQDEEGNPKKKIVIEYEPDDHTHVPHIKAAYTCLVGELDRFGFSVWLSQVITSWLMAVPLRDKGGVWFIAQEKVVDWEALREAIQDVSSHSLYQVPAMPGAMAIEAVLDSVAAEAEVAIGRVYKQLGKHDSGEKTMGKRALESKGRAADTTLEKVAYYEGLLGQRLDQVRAKIDGLKAAISVATLAITGDDE